MAKYRFYTALRNTALLVGAGMAYYQNTDIFSDIGSGITKAGRSIADVSTQAGEEIAGISEQAGKQLLRAGKQTNALVMFALTGGQNKKAARWLRKEADYAKKFFEEKRATMDALLADGAKQLTDYQKQIIDAIATVEKARLDITDGRAQIAKARLAEKKIEELATLERDLLQALQSLETSLNIIAQPGCTSGILCNFQSSLKTVDALLQKKGSTTKILFNRIAKIINTVFVKELRATAQLLDP